MARSLFRDTVCINGPAGLIPLAGATVTFYEPDGTGTVPIGYPLYPSGTSTTPVSVPYTTGALGELEVWADEPRRIRMRAVKPGLATAEEVIDLLIPPETAASEEDVSQAIDAHESEADPHEQYLTEPEGDLRYLPVGYAPDLTDYYTKGESETAFLDEGEADLRYEQLSRKGAASGYAPLDFAGVIPNQYLPALAITETFVVLSEAEMLALPAQQGDVAVRLDTTENYILRVDPATVLENWTKLAASTTAGNTSVLRREEFTPAPLATTVTLAAPPTTVHAVSRNGVGQSEPAGHYTVSGLVLTFADPFELGERVAVVYEVGSTVPAPVNGYTKEESDLRYEPIDTMYTKGESDALYSPVAHNHNSLYSPLAHNHDASYLALSGGILTGGLSAPAVTIATKPVNVSPDSGNALVWRSNGFYSSGSGGNVTVVNREEFFPVAAATTVTLAQAPSELLSVSRNGVEQFASAGDYSVAGAVVTFTSAFVAGERVSILSEVGTSVPVDAYDTATADARFVNVAGDQMTGNLGVGVNPEAWSPSYRALRVGGAGSLFSHVGGASNTTLAENNYLDGATTNRAVVAGPGSILVQANGQLSFHSAPSVAAGAAQTFTTRMALAPTGTLTLTPDVSSFALDAHTAITNQAGFLELSSLSQSVRPLLDNHQYLGGASNRWIAVYAATGAINTSTAEAKEGITPLDPAACYQAAKDVRWYDFRYTPPAYQEPPEQEGQEPEERQRQVDESKATHARLLIETQPARHQRGFVFPDTDGVARDEAGGTLPPVPDLFGLEDRQSTTPQADLATLGAALQELIRRFEIVEAKVA